MWEIVPAEKHSAVFPFQNLNSEAIQLSAFSGMGFLNIHPDNDFQATQEGAFSQMGFLGWDFHCDKYSSIIFG